MKTNQLMIDMEIAVGKHRNSPCGQNVEFFNITSDGTIK
jgi:hypothetical protein